MGTIINKNRTPIIFSFEDGANEFMYLKDYEVESLAVAFLNTMDQVIARKDVLVGNSNSTIVDPYEIYHEAYNHSAASIIIARRRKDNTLSSEDILFTKHLKEAGEKIGIELLDYMIIGDRNFTSLKEKGYV